MLFFLKKTFCYLRKLFELSKSINITCILTKKELPQHYIVDTTSIKMVTLLQTLKMIIELQREEALEKEMKILIILLNQKICTTITDISRHIFKFIKIYNYATTQNQKHKATYITNNSLFIVTLGLLLLCCLGPLLFLETWTLLLMSWTLLLMFWSRELPTPPAVSTEELWSSSNTLTISSIFGLNLGSTDRHRTARSATFIAWRTVYWPSMRASITWKTRRLLLRYGLAHSIKLCSPDGLLLSSARFPDIISRSTTPKLYTSLFLVKWPVQKR